MGDEYNAFFASLYLPSTLGLRVNTLKIATPEFLDLSPYDIAPIPWSSSGFAIESPEGKGSIPPGKHPYHSAGLYYLQEPSAMAVAEVLAPQPGERVLDLAAAPGGKATHLAALMKNNGLLVANEIHPKRVWDLVENLERCGVTNSIVTNESPQKLADHFEGYFDRVLLDAPCSGEGMFRKSESARREWNLDLAHSCSIRQSSILEQAARMVKPGGHLAYATCTFSADENEGVISKFIAQHPEFELEIIQPAVGFQAAIPAWVGLPSDHLVSRAIRLWPHMIRGEGHFIALMINRASNNNVQAVNSNKADYAFRSLQTKWKNPTRQIFDDFGGANLSLGFDSSRLILDGTYVYQVPENMPYLTGLKVIRPGWWLGSHTKQRFTPSHSLAMGMRGNDVRLLLPLELDDRRLAAYFAGESFPDSGENGWVLVTVDGFPVGWGKRVHNVIKNFYPHGLRHSII